MYLKLRNLALFCHVLCHAIYEFGDSTARKRFFAAVNCHVSLTNAHIHQPPTSLFLQKKGQLTKKRVTFLFFDSFHYALCRIKSA